jgi:hypothetical protein
MSCPGPSTGPRDGEAIKVERIYREVNAIGGGAEEIVKELAARPLGL